jgi:hypothetical protein
MRLQLRLVNCPYVRTQRVNLDLILIATTRDPVSAMELAAGS